MFLTQSCHSSVYTIVYVMTSYNLTFQVNRLAGFSNCLSLYKLITGFNSYMTVSAKTDSVAQVIELRWSQLLFSQS